MYVVARNAEVFCVDENYALCENVLREQHDGTDDDAIAIVDLDDATEEVAAAAGEWFAQHAT